MAALQPFAIAFEVMVDTQVAKDLDMLDADGYKAVHKMVNMER